MVARYAVAPYRTARRKCRPRGCRSWVTRGGRPSGRYGLRRGGRSRYRSRRTYNWSRRQPRASPVDVVRYAAAIVDVPGNVREGLPRHLFEGLCEHLEHVFRALDVRRVELVPDVPPQCPELYPDARQCPELYPDARQCPELYPDARQCPELYPDARQCPELYPDA
eukprot:3540711-Rhodomonas_salina.1